jgi:predicted RNase H-like HicB family nuclease
MQPHKYELVVWWSPEDEVFVVDVPELPGCMAHGGTPGEAVMNAGDAIDLWIDTAKAARLPVPEPRGGRVEIA